MRLVIALALAGCSAGRTIPSAPVAPAAVVAPDTELAPQLRISGNHALTTARLRGELAKVVCDARHQIDQVIATATKGLDTPPCGTPEDYRISVEVLYLAEGFPDAKASVVTRHGAPPTIVVDEGPRYHLGSIVTVDQLATDRDDALAHARDVELTSGEPFNRDRIRAALERITDRYVRAGYRRANVTPVVTLDTTAHRVDLTIEIERGERD